MRSDAECCSTRCRQARHRFTTATTRQATPESVRPLRLAYADPPYPGKAELYRGHPDYAGEVDHAQLLTELAAGYDGWALSTSAEALPWVAAIAHRVESNVRVAAWFRGERKRERSHAALSSWEPVLYKPARSLAGLDLDELVIDSLDHIARPRLTDANRVIGAKPATFCRWVFELIAAHPDDELVDLFPGSGGVARAWDVWRS